MPWSLPDARTTFFTTALGSGLLVWAWWESSGTGKLHHQTTWTVVGVLAVAVIGLGNILWISSGRRAVLVRRDELVGRIEDTEPAAAPGTSSLSALADSLVMVAGSGRYHRLNCQLVQGKPVHRLPDGPDLDGLRACEMCEP